MTADDSLDHGSPMAPCVLSVDLDAIVANWRTLAARAAPAECAAVVKADGYGLGAVPVARALTRAGCRLFFVARLEEGIALRQALPAPDIAVLDGLLPRQSGAFIGYRLLPVLNDPGQVAGWFDRCAGSGVALPAILQLDSGMTRAGLTPAQALSLADTRAAPAFPWRAVISHLACADTPDHPRNEAQRAAFVALAAAFPQGPRSLAASSGIFLGNGYMMDLVRPGAALYGVNPTRAAVNPMQPVVRLHARLLQARCVDSAQAVGYGATATVPPGTKIATISIGYADGLPRASGGRGTMRLGNWNLPVIGRISMDLTTLDASAVPDADLQPGRWVEVLGAGRSLDDLAADSDTIGYEILTGIAPRVQRRHLGGEV